MIIGRVSDGDRTEATGRLPRAAAAAAGSAGGAWGVLAGLGALGVIAPAPLHSGDGRVGRLAGLLAIGFAVAALGGGVAALRLPAAGCVLLTVATVGGPMAVGTAWLGPGASMLIGAALALWATHDPFAREIAREREVRTRGRPG